MDEPLVSLLNTLNKYLSTEFTFNPFHATGLFLYPLKPSGTISFLMLPEGIERDQWHEMGY